MPADLHVRNCATFNTALIRQNLKCNYILGHIDNGRALWVEVVEGSVQRPFADAGRTGEYDEASHREKRTLVPDNARQSGTFLCDDGYCRDALY